MALNFTPIFNATSDLVHVNSTYILSQQPDSMITPDLFLLFICLGIGLMILSCLTTIDACNDLSGILGTIFLFISAISAFNVDVVTGTGVASQCLALTSGVCSQAEWVLLENHTIYHFGWIGIVLGFIFLISLANLYRLWTDYRRVIGSAKNVGSVSGAPETYNTRSVESSQINKGGRDENDGDYREGHRDHFRK
jgi:hypothetical protein